MILINKIFLLVLLSCSLLFSEKWYTGEKISIPPEHGKLDYSSKYYINEVKNWINDSNIDLFFFEAFVLNDSILINKKTISNIANDKIFKKFQASLKHKMIIHYKYSFILEEKIKNVKINNDIKNVLLTNIQKQQIYIFTKLIQGGFLSE